MGFDPIASYDMLKQVQHIIIKISVGCRNKFGMTK